jgi:hypothetical protein
MTMRSAASWAARAATAAVVAAGGGAAGCATTVYHPVDAVRAADDPRPAAITYGIVGKNGKGQLHVFSLGGKKLPVGPSGASVYLHLRLAAVNAGDDLPWVLDPNDQHLGLDGRMEPAAFSTTSQGRPVLWLARGASGYLDLYYPLPDIGDPPRVTLAWRLRRGTAAAAQVTEFVRVSGRKIDGFALASSGGGRSEIFYHHYTGAHWGMGWWWPESCLWWHDWHGGHGLVAGRYYDDGQRWQQHPTPRTLERQRVVAEAASRSSQDWDRSDTSWTNGGSRSGGGYGSSDTSHWRNPGGSSSYSSSSSSSASSSSSSSSAESSGGGSPGGGSAPTFAPGDAAKSGWRGGGAN